MVVVVCVRELGSMRTRSRTRALAAPPLDVLSLPDELLLEVGRHALAAHLPSLLRLGQACRALHDRLRPVRAQAEAPADILCDAPLMCCAMPTVVLGAEGRRLV